MNLNLFDFVSRFLINSSYIHLKQKKNAPKWSIFKFFLKFDKNAKFYSNIELTESTLNFIITNFFEPFILSTKL